mgnify:CR=1 FL=1
MSRLYLAATHINSIAISTMKIATVIGYHGHRNFGDDIFLKITCRWLRQSMGVGACFVSEKKGTVTRTLAGVNLIPFFNPYSRISRFMWLPILLRTMKSDFMVFSAGSIFTIQPFSLMHSTLWLLKLLRGHKLQIMAVGVSIGPFTSKRDEYWCARSLALMDYVLLRDNQSKQRVDAMHQDIHSILSYDLALSWGDALPYPEKKEKLFVIGLAITVRGFGSCLEEHSRNCKVITRALASILKQFNQLKLRIFSVCSDPVDGDQHISHHIRNQLSEWGDRIETVVYDGDDIDGMLESMGKCSLMIASRMHAGVVAMLASIPVYQISYAEKIRNFFVHSGLSTIYLYDHSEVSERTLSEFLHAGLAGELKAFANKQKIVLAHKGEHVRESLLDLAEYSKAGISQ